jgi:phage tail sheath protein FI
MIQIIAGLIALLWAFVAQVRPAVEVDVLTSPQPAALPADSTTWFVVGLCDFGRTDRPIQVTNMNEFVAKCGARVSYSVLYDALDTFFREGGSNAWVGRVIGPGATFGVRSLLDAGAAVSLIVTALGAGANSVNITVQAVAGSQGGKDYGPGQVSAPGRTTTAGYNQLLDHAAANFRTAILDAPNTPTAATLTAISAATGANEQYGGLFAPWLIAPGVIAGTTRTVPPSGLVAGAIARSDPANGPGAPAAGNNGIGQFVNNISQPAWDDTTRNTLNNAGVNVIRLIAGQVKIFGWRSLANPNVSPGWVNLGTVRYLQNLSSRAWRAGQGYLFQLIDGQGHTIARYVSALTALLLADWNSGQIYGASSADAFLVDAGPTVNTPTTLSQNMLIANIAVRPSPMAELIKIQIVNVPITQIV